MKKLFSVMAVLIACATMAEACGDDDDNKGNGGGGQEPQTKYRVKTYSLVGDGWADVYQYTYDTQGRVTRIFREEGKDYRFAWTSGGINVTNTVAKEDGTGTEEKSYCTMELNASGYVSKMTDEWGDVREYAYDAAGHMIQIKKNGEVVSTITIADGCIETWTRLRDGETQTKNHTYLTTPNTYAIQNIHSEATDPSRWMYETGLFGKPSDYLCASSKWAHSDIGASYEYEFDENGCVTKENKNYDGEMEYFEYTWEEFE